MTTNLGRAVLGAIGAIFLLGLWGGMVGTAISGRLLDRLPRGHLLLGLAQLIRNEN